MTEVRFLTKEWKSKKGIHGRRQTKKRQKDEKKKEGKEPEVEEFAWNKRELRLEMKRKGENEKKKNKRDGERNKQRE